jgi:hypothetical protein
VAVDCDRGFYIRLLRNIASGIESGYTDIEDFAQNIKDVTPSTDGKWLIASYRYSFTTKPSQRELDRLVIEKVV